MQREYPERPIIGVACVILDRGRVLLAQRGRDPGKGTWSLPGGAVEVGETLETALKREVREEVSLRIEVGGLVRLFERIVPDERGRTRFHYVIADYWGWPVGGRPRPDSDVGAIRWVDLKEIHLQEIEREVLVTIRDAERMRNCTQGVTNR